MLRFLLQVAAVSQVLGHTADSVKELGNVTVVELSGSYYSMGEAYGSALQQDLKRSLNILLDYYVTEKGFTYSQVVEQADLFYQRFPEKYHQFIEGYSSSANITLSDAKILHAMETLGELNDNALPQCAFAFSPPTHDKDQGSIIGRNYDYGAPCNKIAERLVVAVLKGDGSEKQTALITMPGQVYCPSCLSAEGLFIEMNNGMPSGGYQVNHTTQSLLVDMHIALKSSASLEELRNQLLNVKYPDYSLIVNMGSDSECYSLEFSSNTTLGMKEMTPQPNSVFVSTNFFQNSSWGTEVPKPTDASTWLGITRRDNLLHLLNTQFNQTATTIQDDMNKSIMNGGAKWMETIYQIIFDIHNMELFLKPRHDSSWTSIPLGNIFEN
eukprot:TRINITY_DN21080_c0_g1_i1.p1 TRINITY_DN21080_c0_g1~~TRINITY_DN21080_c0_g1_i1.p1  ORF type:complete len:408 (+),score=54.64 TRINITY_DN21080_c0_g1_i1:77-1225(+)